MIGKKMAKALTKQINAELYSSYLYMAMSSYAGFKGWHGAARWLEAQAQEEAAHALRFYKYLTSQGEHVVFAAIEQPPADFQSMPGIFEEVLKHEKKVTSLIHDLMNLALEEKDHATQIALQWFVSEQVEEEEHASEIVQKLQMAGSHMGALMYIDKELGSRKSGA
jgi:ferritin